MSEVEQFEDGRVLSLADAVLERRFRIGDEPEVRFAEAVDWRHNPTLDRRARWTRELNRHRWLPWLIRAYEVTGDEHYARCAVDLLEHWIRANPPPRQKNESDPIWTLMGAGMRAVVWAPAFAFLIRSQVFSEQAQMLVLRSVSDHADFLAQFHTHLNHLLREANGLACIGVAFPEFRSANRWRKTATNRLMEAIDGQVYEDGVHMELSSGYQWLVAEEFLGALDLLALSADQCSEELSRLNKRVEQLYEVLMVLARPNGSWPQLSDGFMDSVHTMQRRLRTAASRFKREDMAYVASVGKSGVAPAFESRAFTRAGLVVLRDGWQAHCRYMTFDAGPFGGPHGHEDALSVEVYAHGQAFVVDPGTYTYHASDPYRDYFVSSRAHNTVLVDGMSQVRRWNQKNLQVQCKSARLTTCLFSDKVDYVVGIYSDPYGNFRFNRPSESKEIKNIVHERRILSLRDRYWLILDSLSGVAGREMSQVFQCHPDVRAELLEHCGHRLLGTQGSMLDIVPAVVGDNVRSRSARGEELPPCGWYSNGTRNNKQPSTTLAYLWHGEGDAARIATLLFPRSSATSPCSSPRLILEEWSGRIGVHMRVCTDEDEDWISIVPERGERLLAGFPVRGTVSGVRLESSGATNLLFDCVPGKSEESEDYGN
jgi:hypothetical protein